MTPHRRGTSPKMTVADQKRAVQQVTHTSELSACDRAAAILVLVFGQQVEDVVRLTWDDVTVTDDLVMITLGTVEIALPEPLDVPWRELAANRPGYDLIAAHPNSNWVFRGYSPGRHVHAASLRNWLRGVFGTRAARLGTLHELTKLAPVAIIADALGYSPATIERHARASSATYAEYVSTIHERSRRNS